MKNTNRKYLLTALLYLITFSLATPGLAENPPDTWSESASKIEQALNHALKTYRDGKNEAATEMVSDAYFGLFENEKANMEIAVRRSISFKVAVKIEKNFNKLRRAMHEKEDISSIEKRISSLILDVKKAAQKLDKKGVIMNNNFN